jgi:hypothetical protein
MDGDVRMSERREKWRRCDGRIVFFRRDVMELKFEVFRLVKSDGDLMEVNSENRIKCV